MKKLIYLLPLLLVIVILSRGCNYDNPLVSTIQNPVPSDMIYGPIDSGMYTIHMGQIFEAPLITSANLHIGVLQVWFDSTNFYYKYIADSAYYLKNLHLAAVSERFRIPLSGSCPDIENFKNQVHNLPANTKVYVFTVPIASLETPSHTVFVSSEIDYENITSFEPNCLVAWARGVSFWNCTQFNKYFGLRYSFKRE